VLATAWAEPAAWTGTTSRWGLELSNERWGQIVLTEMVVHGWDVARGTGQTFELPERTLQAVFDHVTTFVPNSPAPDAFGPLSRFDPMPCFWIGSWPLRVVPRKFRTD
jgi:uncharacterized protein (TIGR03086 family)